MEIATNCNDTPAESPGLRKKATEASEAYSPNVIRM